MKAIEIKLTNREDEESQIIVVKKIEGITFGKKLDVHGTCTGIQTVEKSCYTIYLDSGKYATVNEEYTIIDCDTEEKIPFSELKKWFKKQIKEL